MCLGCGIVVISDQRECSDVRASRRVRLSRQRLTSMINSDRVVVAKLAEELATVGNGVVKVARDLDGLTLLLLNKSLDMLLSLGHVLRAACQLDASLAITLAGNVDRDGELGLELALCITTTANERTVVLNRNIHNLSDLALTLTHNLLNTLNNLVHNISATLNLDSISISLLLGELNGASKLSPVVRATGLDDNVAKVGACNS
jgi:hypothetical protein